MTLFNYPNRNFEKKNWIYDFFSNNYKRILIEKLIQMWTNLINQIAILTFHDT